MPPRITITIGRDNPDDRPSPRVTALARESARVQAEERRSPGALSRALDAAHRAHGAAGHVGEWMACELLPCTATPVGVRAAFGPLPT